MLDERIVCAGFSGQGIMSIGELLAYAGMAESREVSWVPSYGPEMRGGTANCSVMISENPIGSPLVAGDATAAIIMNIPSLEKFESEVAEGGIILVNSSLVKRAVARKDITPYYIPANEIAEKLGDSKAANMVMLGAYLAIKAPVSIESVKSAFANVFEHIKPEMLELDKAAIEEGYEQIKKTP